MNLSVKETQLEKLREHLKAHSEPTPRVARLLAVRYSLYALTGEDCDEVAKGFAPAPAPPAKRAVKKPSLRRGKKEASPAEEKADEEE